MKEEKKKYNLRMYKMFYFIISNYPQEWRSKCAPLITKHVPPLRFVPSSVHHRRQFSADWLVHSGQLPVSDRLVPLWMSTRCHNIGTLGVSRHGNSPGIYWILLIFIWIDRGSQGLHFCSWPLFDSFTHFWDIGVGRWRISETKKKKVQFKGTPSS